MRAVLQRVMPRASVGQGNVAGEIGAGLLVLLGVAKGDTPAAAAGGEDGAVAHFQRRAGQNECIAARKRRRSAGGFAVHALR